LGALTYEMLTGEPPHVGSTSQAVIARVLTERPRSIRATRPSVPEHVEAAVDQALEKLPADRWASAPEVAGARAGTRQAIRTAAALVGGVAAPRLAVRARELVGWTLVAVLAGVATWLGVRATRPAPMPTTAEFEIALPEGFTLPTAGAAGSIA